MDSRSDVRWDPAAREELPVAMGLKKKSVMAKG